MLDYQPLNSEKNELRLLYFLQDSDSLAASATPEYPQGIVELELKVVSLDEYTEYVLKFMKSNGLISYKYTDYLRSRLPPIKPFESDADIARGVQLLIDGVAEIMSGLDYGRWEWGDYMTLSYVWGVTRASRPVIINGSTIEVMENLEDYLRKCVASSVPESPSTKRNGLWIDAICINQNDVEERNAQIKRMGNIYQNSATTIAWLGKEADESDKAMDLLISLSKHQFDTKEEAITRLNAIMKSEPPKLGRWKALEDLPTRPYWSRLWVIQEIVLSGEGVSFECGNLQIGWRFLRQVIKALSHCIDEIENAIRREYADKGIPRSSPFAFIEGIHRIQQFGTFRDAEETKLGRPDLKHIFSVFQYAEQQDPKDKIYGTLSLIDPNISELIVPNYSKTVSEIFTDFTKCIISSTKRLDVVAYWGKPKEGQRTLPSWVLDLTEKPAVSLELTYKYPYLADNASEAIVRFHNNHLIARGFIVDDIDGLGPCMSNFYKTDIESGPVQPLCRKNPYQNEGGARDALWRTLIANRNGVDEIAPGLWKELLEIPWNDDFVSESCGISIRNFNLFRLVNSKLEFNGCSFMSYFPPLDDNNKKLIAQECINRTAVQFGRRLTITGKGYFGLVAMPAQRGDAICILLGCSVPVILRPSEDRLSYQIVGESYIHGFMEGEAMGWLEEGKYKLEEFTIT